MIKEGWETVSATSNCILAAFCKNLLPSIILPVPMVFLKLEIQIESSWLFVHDFSFRLKSTIDLLLLYFYTLNLLTFLRISAACTNLRAFIRERAAIKSVCDAYCIILYFLKVSDMFRNLVSSMELGLEFTAIPYTFISFIFSFMIC